MAHNILLTGASGYLGGTLLARWAGADLPSHGTLFALVRTPAQADAVKTYGAEPLTVDPKDPEAVRAVVLENEISVVYYLIEAGEGSGQVNFIKALGELGKKTGKTVHFLHTTGAKLFSSLAGAPTDRPLYDNDPELYSVQKAQKAPGPFDRMQGGVDANNQVIEAGEKHGVRTYIFAPCIVYGKGEGFGNPISIQTVAVVQAAKAARGVYDPNEGHPTWPVCHISDNTTLYLALLRSILKDETPGHGRNGYYLASPGSVAWHDIYVTFAEVLARRGVVDDAAVKPAKEDNLEAMAAGLKCPKNWVVKQLGGSCTFTAIHGKELGWKPQFAPEHILEDAANEVDLILGNIKD